jgi:surface antigen
MKVNNISNVTAIRVGKELIIPGAVKKTIQKSIAKIDTPPGKGSKIIPPTPSTTPQKTPTPVIQSSGLQDRYTVKYTGLSRGFAAGNCTWYVAQNKSVSWRGNANQWMRNAKAAGVKTGQTPLP